MGHDAFRECQHGGGQVERLGDGHWRLQIPAGPAKPYRLAQIDNYSHLARKAFTGRPPCTLHLRARVSSPEMPGTWGFGFWNDPFSANIGLRGTARRFPALPDAAWFFHASTANYLSLRDDQPAHGFLAATFSARRIPAPLLALGLPALPLLAWPPASRLLRRAARWFVNEDAARVDTDPTRWHTYRLEWLPQGVRFFMDGALCFQTAVCPNPPLGLVIWIDNQFAAFPPSGRLGFGTLPNLEPAWLEIALQNGKV